MPTNKEPWEIVPDGDHWDVVEWGRRVGEIHARGDTFDFFQLGQRVGSFHLRAHQVDFYEGLTSNSALIPRPWGYSFESDDEPERRIIVSDLRNSPFTGQDHDWSDQLIMSAATGMGNIAGNLLGNLINGLFSIAIRDMKEDLVPDPEEPLY